MPVVPALMALTMMTMSRMFAMHLRAIGKRSRKQGVYRLIRTPGHTAIKLNACFHQGRLRTRTDSAADQCVHTPSGKQSRQSAVPISIGIHHLCICNFSASDLVNLKLLCPTKMRKYISIVVSNCYLHLCLISALFSSRCI